MVAHTWQQGRVGGSCLAFLCMLTGISAACGLLPEFGPFPGLGYRPDFPEYKSSPLCREEGNDIKKSCDKFYNVVQWREDVGEANKVRALVNEWAIYVAGAVGIIGEAVVGTLTATEKGNTDTAKIIPPVSGAIAALLALNQSDDKAAAYGEAVIAIEEAKTTALQFVRRHPTKQGFDSGAEILEGSIHQEMVNLKKRLNAIRQKQSASIPTITAMVKPSFTEGVSPEITLLTTHLEDDTGRVRVMTMPETAVTNTAVKRDRVEFMLDKPECRSYMVTLSVENTLVLPPKLLRCEKKPAS